MARALFFAVLLVCGLVLLRPALADEPLDLSKPVDIIAGAPACPSEDAVDAPQHCTTLAEDVPVTIMEYGSAGCSVTFVPPLKWPWPSPK